MSKLTIYTDGSERTVTRVRELAHNGWGVVARHEDHVEELLGCYITTAREQRGWHEFVAFVSGMKYAISNGYAPEDVLFYTDYAWLVQIGPQLQNGSKKASATLAKFHSLFFADTPELLEELTTWLTTASVRWVKAHAKLTDFNENGRSLNNNRANYLAGQASALSKEGQPETSWLDTLLSFAEWVAKRKLTALTQDGRG